MGILDEIGGQATGTANMLKREAEARQEAEFFQYVKANAVPRLILIGGVGVFIPLIGWAMTLWALGSVELMLAGGSKKKSYLESGKVAGGYLLLQIFLLFFFSMAGWNRAALWLLILTFGIAILMEIKLVGHRKDAARVARNARTAAEFISQEKEL
ncbi:hypothetical protein BBC27_08785 [Acidithiobacillus ferrivorans]|uniref:Uncharacterized protein n=1 Tax=Acidithiobacillus ferrivorans TaxID=160808 RepID=A0A1B9BZY7_9PROT|nr:hypothetical protein [Acidithiobacillus ferrivorans]OCB03279.1 hypothetical protein BBC27_08785 [Acidithiobacillus ferrivorans]